ncbi:sugar ABC transporter substrate-binding protein [Leucobacter sp. CSA1]|uniref:Sugar ABC transporter substrate-binding protein n=1 Tax=Leucobacter chromiisoli TaxID=2796471 RepID=A0A934Q8T4_9MICO|nr:sugar ABC transporter substrate-binding protein [Leucobacter chromiisoli]MBK0418657.1 sugar ABC transporter substrate-binding protein [Leucobacter chromiisoli]
MKPSRISGGIAVIATAAIAMTACSAPDSGGSDGDLSGTEINVLALQDPFFYALEEVLPEFEEETGITVNLEGVDYDTLNSRATNSFTANQGDIDVIAPDSMWLSRFAESGWLEPLSERIVEDNDEVQIEDFVPASLHSLSEWKGELYTLPVATYGAAVFYRPSVFEALGIEAPPQEASEDWTWDRYMEIVEQIQGQNVDGTDMYGTVVLGSGPQPINHMYTQLAASKGARWFEAFPDASEWDFTPTWDSEESVESMEFYRELYKNSPAESINYLWFDAGTRFGSGDVGMMYHWTPYSYLVQRTEYMGTTESAAVDDYALAAMPQEPGQDQVINIGGFAFGVGANSGKKDAAWEFVKWASSAETQKKMALLDMRQFSDFSRASLYEDAELVEAYPSLPVQLEMINEGNGKTVRPPIQNYATLEQSIGNTLNKMLVDDMTGEETAERINSDLASILEEEGFIPWEGESYDAPRDGTEPLLQELAG